MSAKLFSLLIALGSVAAVVPWPGTAPRAAAPAGMAVDGGHSSVVFRVMHMETANFYGRFNKISGDVQLEEKNGGVTIEIDADSIDTNSPQRDGHLKSQDFFSVKEF